MYNLQQQIYQVLREKVSSFDPVAMGLTTMIEENPDPDAMYYEVDTANNEVDIASTYCRGPTSVMVEAVSTLAEVGLWPNIF